MDDVMYFLAHALSYMGTEGSGLLTEPPTLILLRRPQPLRFSQGVRLVDELSDQLCIP